METDTKLLRIMLVDDEPVMLMKLKTLINYSDYGFEICAEASNGKNAMELIAAVAPDILFTDMKMPAVDGIGLINYVRQHYPGIRIISISGYEDFQYVYQSLSQGAADYLLKYQLDPERMADVLYKVRQQIMQEQDENRRKDVEKTRLTKADQILWTETLRSFVADGMLLTEEQRVEFIRHFPCYYLILMTVDRFTKPGRQDQILAAIIEKICSEAAVTSVIYMGEGRYLIVLSIAETVSEQRHHDLLFDSMRRCQNSALRLVNQTLSCCRSGLLTDPMQAHAGYQHLLAVIDGKFYCGDGRILSGLPPQDKIRQFSFPDENMVDNIWIETLKQTLADYFVYAKDIRLASGKLKELCSQIIGRLLIRGKKWGVQKTELPFIDCAQVQSFDKLRSGMEAAIAYVQSALAFLPEPQNHSVNVKAALDFIHSNFQNPISLDTVSRAVGLNDAYLSRIFKEEAGKGMLEYIRELRIQKAKILLTTSSLRIKNICNMCGFNDYGYFIRAFKTATGQSPVEYRQKK